MGQPSNGIRFTINFNEEKSMKTPTHQSRPQHAAGATAERSIFKLNPLTAACAMAIFAASSMAYAQSATTDAAKAAAPVMTKAEKDKAEAAKKAANTVDTIVVTGIRRGIEAAISVKQNSNSIVEAISAEDIGKLPDNSIAESIARLPGLAAQRVAGRSSTISIRGMSGDFAGTLLNGREQVSTGDNRAVEFDQYPSELLAGVVVYKTPDGALIGQGLSGTVDLQTVRPLNFSKQTVAVNLRGEKNSLGKLNADSKDTGNRFSASYIDQSADKKFGIALGFAHLDSPSQAQRWNAWGYPCNDKGECALGGNKVFADSTNQKRDGVMAVLEFKPNADYSSVVDLYYSKFDKKTVLRGFEAGLVWGDGTTLTNPVIANKFLVSGTWNGVKPVVRNDLNKQKDDLSAFGWNNKFNLGNGWTAVGDLSFSQAKRTESILETYAGTIPGSAGAKDSFTFTSNNDTGLPSFKVGLNYADPSIIKLVDSGGWGQDGYIKYLNVKDEASAFKLTGKKDLEGVFSSVDFGINYATRKKSKDVPEFFVNLKTRPASGNSTPPANANVPAGSLLSPSNIGFVGMPGILAYDIQAVVDAIYTLKPNFNKDITNKNWVVEEKIIKEKAAESVKDFFVLLEKQEFDKIKVRIEPSSMPNLEILIREAEQKKVENKERETITTEILETVIIAPDRVNCRVKCKIKDKEIIEIMQVMVDKDKKCFIYVLPIHLKIFRFVVFSNRYELFFVEYHKEKKHKKKKKHHDHGKHKGHKHDNDEDDD